MLRSLHIICQKIGNLPEMVLYLSFFEVLITLEVMIEKQTDVVSKSASNDFKFSHIVRISKISIHLKLEPTVFGKFSKLWNL